MCAIFGIVALGNKTIGSSQFKIFDILRLRLAHRGPDGFSSKQIGNRIILGHHRLSINDVNNGSQPFDHGDGLFSIVNGEIYNYPLLTSAMPCLNRIQTQSDCEVLAPLTVSFPEDIWRSINGMFAAAVVDTRKNFIYLLRDFYGEKPLYYVIDRGYLYFASEYQALVAAGFRSSILSPEQLSLYFLYGYVPSENRSVDLSGEITELPRSSCLRISLSDSGKVWFKHKVVANDLGLYDTLTNYMSQSTLSDVPISIGLSAGLDSTFIISRLHKSISHAYTVCYDASGGSDELDDASRIARYFSVPHSSVAIRDQDVYVLFKESVFARDHLVSDFAGIGYYALYKKAAEDGNKVILMGHGGDELFFGYPWLYSSYKANMQSSDNNLILYQSLPDFRVYFRLIDKVFNKELNKWYLYPVIPKTSGLSIYSQLVTAVTDFWLEPNSLTLADSLSMSCGIEARSPLLSLQTLESNILLESENPMQGAKSRLRKFMMRDVPEELIQRNKKYFAPPYMHYYSLIHKGLSNDLLEGKSYPYLKGISCLDQSLIDHVLYSSVFHNDFYTYYLFPRLATLHFWLQRNSSLL